MLTNHLVQGYVIVTAQAVRRATGGIIVYQRSDSVGKKGWCNCTIAGNHQNSSLPFSFLGTNDLTYTTKWQTYGRTPLLSAESLPDKLSAAQPRDPIPWRVTPARDSEREKGGLWASDSKETNRKALYLSTTDQTKTRSIFWEVPIT